jgi:NitT/TauT family transport system substrate-binding protein
MRLARTGVRHPALSHPALRLAPVAVSVAVLAAGCHVPGTSSSASVSGDTQITVAVVPGLDTAPLQVALKDKLFEQAGLQVTVRDYPSLTAEFQALTGGQAQIAAGDYTGFFYQQATGRASLRLIADGYDAASNSVAILTLPGSGITTPQQLAGRAGGVATPPAQMAPYSRAVPYNIQTLAAEEVLQNDGVSPSSVTWTQMQPQDMIGALKSGQVAAILVSEPYILEAEKQLGAVEVMDASTGVTSGLPMSGYFSQASFAHANPSVVRAFAQALDQAQSDCAQRGPVQTALSGLAGLQPGDASLVTLGTYPTSLNVGQVQRLASLMYDSGMISNQVSVGSLTSG